MQGISPYPVIMGGNTRCESLRNALECVDTPFVLVSDVARWNVIETVVRELLECMEREMKCEHGARCVVPYLPVADTSFYDASLESMAKSTASQNTESKNTQSSAPQAHVLDSHKSQYLTREYLKLIQTPQLSHTHCL